MVHRGRRRILDGLTFSVPAGSATGLLDPSGSGKTTLMRCVVGVQRGATGTVRVLGHLGERHRLGYHHRPAGGHPDAPPRPPAGSGNTTERILDAARRIFGERGTTGRRCARSPATAGLDPGMVRHFFGDKEGLFQAALEMPFDPDEAIPRLLSPGLDGLGERMVRFLCALWEGERGPAPFVAVLRGATPHEQSAAMLREFVTRALIGRVAAALDRPQPALRATLVASRLVGLGLVRHVLRIEPLASAPVSTVVAVVGPTVQRYLTDDLAGVAAVGATGPGPQAGPVTAGPVTAGAARRRGRTG